MATEQPYAFTKKAAKRIVSAVRKVEGNDGPKGAPPSAGKPQFEAWLEITGSSGAPNENVYTVSVYASPYAENTIAEGKKAWNIAERHNNSSNRCGYPIVEEEGAECGDVVDMEALPTYRRYKADAFAYRNDSVVSDSWGYVFSERLRPLYKE